jgi:predicted PhzF superfamily epimerase YddE/YHI9
MPYSGTNRIAELSACLRLVPEETFSSPFGLIAVFADEKDVAALRPDLGQLSRLPEDVVIATAPARSADFAIRVFAPKVGLPEDPVCGTAHRILTPLWAERIGRDTLMSHQLSARTGELICRLEGDMVAISGRAVTVIDGTWAAHV